MAGAVFAENWVDSRSAKRCNFQYNNATPKREKQPRRMGGCEMTSSCSDHGRTMLGSCSNRSRIVNDTSTVFGQFHLDFGMQFCVAGAVFGDLGVSLFVPGAAFGDLGVSLFVAGAVFGDLGASLFVAGAVFGDLGVSLFVASAIFGEN